MDINDENFLSAQKIVPVKIEDEMQKSYIDYAMSVIISRALPDVRDGLKPVHRRILYTMYEDKLWPNVPYRKCANVVGDAMGRYHPHGDSSIYDALVRLAQNFSLRYPLVDGHGNFGSMDNDPPAAMRYTECKLQKVALEMLEDLDKETVDLMPNYDDRLKEPTVLPAKLPYLLVNGAYGIAVGMASNIPPHNLGEVVDGTIAQLDNPEITNEELMKYIKGPDFPTAGIIVGKEGMKDAYTTGRGKVTIRARTEIEEDSRGRFKIIVTEIPYQVNKAALVESIAKLVQAKTIEGISDLRDETDRETGLSCGVRIVIELKRDANPNVVLNQLFKHTQLQNSQSMLMLAIVDGVPKVLQLREILGEYIKHRENVVIRRTEYDLKQAEARIHILEGLKIAIDNIDRVIQVIRNSYDDAKENLMKEFEFSEPQAEAIVTLQLYRLSNTDITELQEEMKNLSIIISTLRSILSDEEKLKNFMKDELRKIKKEYAVDRKTEIKDEITEININPEELIVKEDVIVVVTKDGYVKRVSNRSYASSNNEDTLVKEGDYVIGTYSMNTIDTVLLFTNLGNYLYVPIHILPDSKWKEIGKHISNIIPLKEGEEIISSIPVYDFEKEVYITTFTKEGMIKRTLLSEYKLSRYSKPVTNIKLKDKDEVVSVTSEIYNNVLVVTNTGYALRFNTSEIPVTGVKSSGVKSIKLKDDYVVSGILFDDSYDYIAIITNKGTGKRLRISDIELSVRARRGTSIIREVKTNPHRIIRVFKVRKDLIGIKNNNDIDIIKSTELSIMDKYSTGSNITKNITDAFLVKELADKNIYDAKIVEKEVIPPSLDEIDNKMLTIDDFLKDINL